MLQTKSVARTLEVATQEPRALTWSVAGLFLAVGLLFFASLGARDLWNPNEPIYGRAVAEMAQRGDWLIPTINGTVFAEKPILYFWSALASARLVGEVNELSLRIPAALAGLASAVMTYLLVLPYLGRRRACLAVALFATLFQVFWAARAVQMDVLVLASTLGVLVPLTRMLDFQAPPARAFAVAGLAAGLGFLAKGPVTLVIPGLVLGVYVVFTRRLHRLLTPTALLAPAVAVAVGLPWYGLLWLRGETEFLYEVLFRQNVTRFLDAWDHQQPWWYYLKYLWIDYAPWSWFLPAALLGIVSWRRIGEPTASIRGWWHWLTKVPAAGEKRLHRLCWIWIVAVVVFFSLSQSKRAPYILPIAPAVAILASTVIDGWISSARRPRRVRVTTGLALSVLASVFVLAGIAAFVVDLDELQDFMAVARVLGSILVVSGLGVGYGIVVARRRPSLAPMTLLGGIVLLYTVAAVWALPAADVLKSARGFAGEMNRTLAASGGTVVSFGFWDWRSEYSYYADRSIPGLDTASELKAYWLENRRPYVLVEGVDEKELRALLPDAQLVHQGTIGSREAFLFAKPVAP